VCTKITGPLASIPRPHARPVKYHQCRPSPDNALTMPYIASMTKKASIMSNITAVEKNSQIVKPSRMTGA
jgi:hypothetical protein